MPESISDINKTLNGLNAVAPVSTLPAIATVQSLSIPSDANLLLIQVDTQAVRFTFDGSNPTVTNGWLIRASTTDSMTRRFIPIPQGSSTLKLIKTAASATGLYQFYKATRGIPFN